MLTAPLPSRSPSAPYSPFLSDAEMRRAVAAPLRSKGIRGPSQEDAIQSVLLELSRVRVRPPTRGGWLALARHVATQRAIDHVRKRARTQEVDAGPTDLADEHPSAEHDEQRGDPVDARKQLGLLQRQVESGDISRRQLTILEGVADGLDQAQIARELRLSHQTVRNELAIARKTYRSAWALMAAGSVAILVAGLFLYSVFREPEKVAAPPPRPTAEPRPKRRVPKSAPPEFDTMPCTTATSGTGRRACAASTRRASWIPRASKISRCARPGRRPRRRSGCRRRRIREEKVHIA